MSCSFLNTTTCLRLPDAAPPGATQWSLYPHFSLCLMSLFFYNIWAAFFPDSGFHSHQLLPRFLNSLHAVFLKHQRGSTSIVPCPTRSSNHLFPSEYLLGRAVCDIFTALVSCYLFPHDWEAVKVCRFGGICFCSLTIKRSTLKTLQLIQLALHRSRLSVTSKTTTVRNYGEGVIPWNTHYHRSYAEWWHYHKSIVIIQFVRVQTWNINSASLTMNV